MQSLPKKFAFFLTPLSLLSFLSVFASIFGVFSSSPAQAQNSYNAIKNAGGKCMDVQNGYTSKDGTPIQIWDCNGTTAQQWQVSGETIRNAAGKCLDIQNGLIYKDEQPVWLYTCNGSAAQRWTVSSSGQIRNPVSNKCLDVKNGKTATAGTSLQIYGCNGTIAQSWSSGSTPVSRALFPLGVPYTKNQDCLLGGVCAGGGGNIKHTGVDYAVPSGSEVKAACDGVVKTARTLSSHGIWDRFTIIEHTNCGGYSRLYGYYGHIDASVPVGRTVKRGDVIGKVSYWKGNSHLHLGFATQSFNNGWGYQSGDPLKNGWINPISIF